MNMHCEITHLLSSSNYVLDTLVDRFHCTVFMCIWLQFNVTENNLSERCTETMQVIISLFPSVCPPCLQENAVNGDHLWMETSCSGELCYLGEDACLLKTAVSSVHADSIVRASWLCWLMESNNGHS